MTINYKTERIPVHYLKMEVKPMFQGIENIEYSFTELLKPFDVEFYCYLYKSVGIQYHWLDRLVMSENELNLSINKPNVSINVLNINEQLAGWAEFVNEVDYTEILYFGLMPDFIGKGYGKRFLALCINMAWENNPKWIQLNTCDLDHKNALAVYKSLGFIEYKTTIEDRKVLINY